MSPMQAPTRFPLWTLHDEWRAVYASVPHSVEVALGHGLAGLEAFLERSRGVYDVLMVSRPPNLQAIEPLRRRRPSRSTPLMRVCAENL